MTLPTLVLFGAGGKMGFRLTRNLLNSDYLVRHVEVSAQGRAKLADELGVECMDAEVALEGADVVILAVPDTVIGKIAASIEDRKSVV